MKSRAAVAFEAGKPLEIAEVDVGGPAAGEVMVEIKATGVCVSRWRSLRVGCESRTFSPVIGLRASCPTVLRQ